MRKKRLYKIGITSGDPFGIGPEIILKCLNSFKSRNKAFEYILYGDSGYMENLSQRFKLKIPDNLVIKNVYKVKKIPSTHPSKKGGEYAFNSLISAVEDLNKGNISALITAPLSKKGVELNGIEFKGHTEFLAKKAGLKESDVLMSFFSSNIKIAILTNHIPLKKVYKFINKEFILKKVNILIKWHEKIFISTPKVAFLSFNPHKGENGEEDRIIEGIIKRFNFLEGPFSSDSFFARGLHRNFDFVFALYHDQGLIPFKIISKGKGCNVTLGLPFLRVSPDHGPAYNIAGKGIADISSINFCIKFISRILKLKTKGGTFPGS